MWLYHVREIKTIIPIMNMSPWQNNNKITYHDTVDDVTVSCAWN